MGIQGLLPLLKSIHKPTHLRNFAGQTIGVDAYGWLHRGTVACAIELAQQKPTRKHIDFALSRVRMLIHFGVKPYMVFDGDYLPSKAHTEKERAARRKESQKMGLELLAMGRISQAHLELQKAIDVTPLMARELIEELNGLDVPYIVAPYEADSQLAYLEKQNIISGVLSEDSDLLVFGVKCLITKLDQYGECVMVKRAHFTACREISLVGWTDKEFRMMAILSGCDYLPGIDKMGLKTAYRLVRKHKAVERLIRAVQLEGKMKVPAGYLEAYDKAEKTFLHQWVYCPEARCLVNLNSLPVGSEADSMPYIGRYVESELAAGVAAGVLDPNTKERLKLTKTWSQHPASWTGSAFTPIDKIGKPISEFFKPKRTPLAELDPNSFTPSPSQQRLLQNQQGGAWSASQLQSMQPPALSRIATNNAASSAPQPSRRAVSDLLPSMQRNSPKRQRLCSDSALAATIDGDLGLPSATSRFFGKPKPQPSPLIRKASEQRKKNKDDFDLWSDESALEAVAALTETPDPATMKHTPSPKKRKKISVHTDTQSVNDDPEAKDYVKAVDEPQDTGTAESQDTNQALTADESQERGDHQTPDTSFESLETEPTRTAFSKGIDARFTDLKSKFAFQSHSPRNSPGRSKSFPANSRSPLQEAERNNLLGRLARPEKSRGNFSPPKDTVQEQMVSIPALSPVEVVEDLEDLDDEEWLAVENQEASYPPDLAVRGSEDYIVPNSPESVEGDSRHRPKLDLCHFAFAGSC